MYILLPVSNDTFTRCFMQVLDPNPFPGLTVSPIHGVVPVGGVAELKVHLTPNAVMKFDTRVNVSIRGWKTLELRMGGTVEPPVVDIDVVQQLHQSFVFFRWEHAHAQIPANSMAFKWCE